MNKLKIGLLVDDKFARRYVYELADWARQQAELEISYLVIHPPVPDSRLRGIVNSAGRNGFYQFASTLLFRVIRSAEDIFLRIEKSHAGHFDVFDLSGKVSGELIIEPIISKLDLSYEFSSTDVDRVRDLGLDLLIQCGSGVMRGDILRASRLGVVSLGDGFDMGCSAGFWECYYKCPRTGFMIRKLTDDGDTEQILLSGFFPTRYFFALNQANLFRKINPHLKSLLLKISLTGELPKSHVSQRSSRQNLQSPKLRHGIFYVFKITYRLAIKAFFKSMRFERRWGISFVGSHWKEDIFQNGIVAGFPKGRFWADPFLYVNGGKTYCFVEDYVYKTNRGHISALEITDGSVVELGDCIKEPFHLSFPFLFNYEGNLYMCPEASESKQIRVYRSKEFPLSWELSSVIMDGVSAADTVLFEHGGRWWMLTSIDKSGLKDYCSELYLFHAESPLSADWKAHPQNPIRIDSEGGRNAGLILEDGKILRMAQRHGFDQYGEGLLMYEITELSETTYTEQLISAFDPSFRKGVLGTHHLSTTGAVTVFDHVSRSFVP